MTVEPGLTGSATRVVTDGLTAIALGSGDVPVFATPAVLALVEEACVNAVTGSLPDGSTTVGTAVDLAHLAASKVGTKVVARATVTAVDGRSLTFSAEAFDGDTLIARATHTRAIVDREKFLSRLR
jgi:predicted thioesterase